MARHQRNLDPLGEATAVAERASVCSDSSIAAARTKSSAGESSIGAARTKSSAVATTSLEASLLRAVRVSTVLRCCGRSLGSQASLDTNYQLSFQTERIDDFLSHDWASSRLEKLLGLCLVYNSLAALIASLVAAYVLAVLQYGADPLLPAPGPSVEHTNTSHHSYWCQLICPLVFALFFLFWQDMRSFLHLGTRSCFVDKFCIDQANAERKAAGIFGLAGFLRCSEWFIVLWTPNYFTRLWCTYEVASWLYLQKPLNAVLLMPLEHAKTIVTLMFGCCCGFITVSLCVMFMPSLHYLAVTLVLFVPLTVGAHQARRSARHLRSMTEQLTSFSVTSSLCHCCTVHHKQDSGEDIPCDREVVYSTIGDWFGAEGGVEAALARFDHAVRTQFAPKVLEKAGPMQLSYKYTVIVGWPFLFRGCDVLATSDVLTLSGRLNIIIMYPTLAFVAVPAWYKIAMYLAYSLDMWVGIPSNFRVDCAWTLALGGTYSLIILFSWYPLEALASIGADVWLMALASSGLTAAAAGLYFQDMRDIAERLSARAPHRLVNLAIQAGLIRSPEQRAVQHSTQDLHSSDQEGLRPAGDACGVFARPVEEEPDDPWPVERPAGRSTTLISM